MLPAERLGCVVMLRMQVPPAETLMPGILRYVRLLPRSCRVDDAARRDRAPIGLDNEPVGALVDGSHSDGPVDGEIELSLVRLEILGHGFAGLDGVGVGTECIAKTELRQVADAICGCIGGGGPEELICGT